MSKRLLAAALLLPVTLISAVATAGLADASTHQATTSHAGESRKDPASDSSPSQAFLAACHSVTSSKTSQQHCADEALPSFDAARAKEGMGPMTLPSNWATMSPTVQLLTIVNIERVDRGLNPALGLSKTMNSYAETGAKHDEDPPFPSKPHGDVETSNWAGVGTSVLLADFIWTYDDGHGSVNVDCQQNGQGCWGHRHNELYNYGAPLKIGAAFVADPTYGGSMAVEWVGEDHIDKVAKPTWTSIVKKFLPGVSAVSSSATSTTMRIDAWASGRKMNLGMKVISGSASWSVKRSHCSLAAGRECETTVTYNPAGGSPTGTLLVTGPGGSLRVPLHV